MHVCILYMLCIHCTSPRELKVKMVLMEVVERMETQELMEDLVSLEKLELL